MHHQTSHSAHKICPHQNLGDLDDQIDTSVLKSKEEVLQLLQNDGVKSAIADLFVYYLTEFYDVYTGAVVLENGRRPDQISNEVFAAFHHMARGLVVRSANAVEEIEKARSSHIKRATLDSFKVAINAALDYENAFEENLDYVMGNKELQKRADYWNILEHIQKIKQLKRRARNAYQDARKHESYGNFDGACQNYQKALEHGSEMAEILRGLRDDPHVTSALVQEGKRIQEREEDKQTERREKRNDRVVNFIIAILTAFAVVYARDYFFPGLF